MCIKYNRGVIQNMAQHILKCPTCGRINTLTKYGFRHKAGYPKRQQWICNGDSCSHTTCDPIIVKIPKDSD